MGVRARDKIGDWFNSIDNQNEKIEILFSKLNNLEDKYNKLEQMVSKITS